jgi:hypothetical protein
MHSRATGTGENLRRGNACVTSGILKDLLKIPVKNNTKFTLYNYAVALVT